MKHMLRIALLPLVPGLLLAGCSDGGPEAAGEADTASTETVERRNDDRLSDHARRHLGAHRRRR